MEGEIGVGRYRSQVGFRMSAIACLLPDCFREAIASAAEQRMVVARQPSAQLSPSP